MVLGHCGSPQGTAFWGDFPQLPENASIPAVGIGHLQIFNCPRRAQVYTNLSGQDLGSQILPGHGRKMPVHSPEGSVQQKAEGVRMCSVLTEERSNIASPDNLPNSCSCQQPRGRWPGVWSCGRPTAGPGLGLQGKGVSGASFWDRSAVEVPLADGMCLRGQPRWLCQGDEAAQGEATSRVLHCPWSCGSSCHSQGPGPAAFPNIRDLGDFAKPK